MQTGFEPGTRSNIFLLRLARYSYATTAYDLNELDLASINHIRDMENKMAKFCAQTGIWTREPGEQVKDDTPKLQEILYCWNVNNVNKVVVRTWCIFYKNINNPRWHILDWKRVVIVFIWKKIRYHNVGVPGSGIELRTFCDRSERITARPLGNTC